MSMLVVPAVHGDGVQFHSRRVNVEGTCCLVATVDDWNPLIKYCSDDFCHCRKQVLISTPNITSITKFSHEIFISLITHCGCCGCGCAGAGPGCFKPYTE